LSTTFNLYGVIKAPQVFKAFYLRADHKLKLLLAQKRKNI
jgi:hypothetical protein